MKNARTLSRIYAFIRTSTWTYVCKRLCYEHLDRMFHCGRARSTCAVITTRNIEAALYTSKAAVVTLDRVEVIMKLLISLPNESTLQAAWSTCVGRSTVAVSWNRHCVHHQWSPGRLCPLATVSSVHERPFIGIIHNTARDQFEWRQLVDFLRLPDVCR